MIFVFLFVSRELQKVTAVIFQAKICWISIITIEWNIMDIHYRSELTQSNSVKTIAWWRKKKTVGIENIS